MVRRTRGPVRLGDPFKVTEAEKAELLHSFLNFDMTVRGEARPASVLAATSCIVFVIIIILILLLSLSRDMDFHPLIQL